MPRGPRKITLTIYRVKDELSKPRLFLRNIGGLRKLAVKVGKTRIGTLYMAESNSKLPEWLRFFQAAISKIPDFLENSNTKAVLVVERPSGTFALTFGFGRFLLKPDCWQEGFGLRTTLNSIDPEQIWSMERKTFDAIASHTRSVATRPGGADQFGIDIQRDLLRAVTGAPKGSPGVRMSGHDALSVRLPVTVEGVPGRLDAYAERFASVDYKKSFAWIDFIHAVRDGDSIRDELDEILLEAIRSGDHDDIFMAVPEPIEWANVSCFRYTQDGEDHDELDIADFLASLSDPHAVTRGTMDRQVACIGSDADAPIHRWSAWKCLNFETDIKGDHYVLALGHWYKIAPSFAASINAQVAAIPLATLPAEAYNDRDEGAYNIRVAGASTGALALLDRRMVLYGGGQSKIEFCDLYSTTKQLIHVKRYEGSSALSHLFSQGVVSARLTLQDKSFRRDVNALLPITHRFADPNQNPKGTDLEVIYGIIMKSTKPLNEALPFFSRVTLVTAFGNLQLFGCRVGVRAIANNRVA